MCRYFFWKRDASKKIKRTKILFIGNDGRREYDLVLEIAKALPQYEFLLITSNIEETLINSDNVTLIKEVGIKEFLLINNLEIFITKGSSQ